MFFKDVIGQEETKQRLIQEVNEGRIPHAQLICGPEGVGKFPLALAYARYISCTNRGTTDACCTSASFLHFSVSFTRSSGRSTLNVFGIMLS